MPEEPYKSKEQRMVLKGAAGIIRRYFPQIKRPCLGCRVSVPIKECVVIVIGPDYNQHDDKHYCPKCFGKREQDR